MASLTIHGFENNISSKLIATDQQFFRCSCQTTIYSPSMKQNISKNRNDSSTVFVAYKKVSEQI